MLESHRDRSNKRRVLLDTNVWRYIVDVDSALEFQHSVNLRKFTIVTSPSVLYEVLRIKTNNELRDSLVELLTFKKWKHLMPEAFSETQELLGEIRRCRPEWLRSKPNKRKFMALMHDWRKRSGFWSRVRTQTELEARILDSLDEGDLESARMQARLNRGTGRVLPWSDTVPLDSIRAVFPSPKDGWDGEAFEAWRMDGLLGFSFAFQQVAHPYTQWLSGHVDFETIASAESSWIRFWIYDAEKERMPRCWLRWAFQYLQSFGKVTDGTPCDIQLATYLPECDLFISADRALVRMIGHCRSYAPCRLPDANLISGGGRGVEELFKLLETE